MRRRIIAGAIVTIVACPAARSSTASAEEVSSHLARYQPAPSEALELKLGTGYAQGFGSVAPARPLSDVVGAGLAVNADIDYRLTPWLSLGFEGQYQQFTSEQNSAARGAALDFAATYHFQPIARGDPWVRLGSGYRWLWENNPQGATGSWAERNGFDLLTAKFGYDVRSSEDVALGPLVGAGLTTFVWEQFSGSGMHLLSSVQVGTFLFAGLQARFDIGGSRGGGAERASAPTALAASAP